MAKCRYFLYTLRQKKGTTFLLWINLLICNVIWQTLVLLSSVNIIIDVTYLISGIYTNLCTFLCKKCDIGYYVINHGVYRRRTCYWLVFIVSISLLCKILNACQNKYPGLYLILSLMYVKKFTSFCQVLKKMHKKENWFLFFCVTL